MRARTDLIEGVLTRMGAQISDAEKTAVKRVLDAAEDYGYGNMIAWLATAWADNLRKQGFIADPKDFAGGRCYPLPVQRKERSHK